VETLSEAEIARYRGVRTMCACNRLRRASRGMTQIYDARVRMVALTEEGSRVLAEALARWEQVQRAVPKRFGEQRLRALYAELDELAAVAGV